MAPVPSTLTGRRSFAGGRTPHPPRRSRKNRAATRPPPLAERIHDVIDLVETLVAGTDDEPRRHQIGPHVVSAMMAAEFDEAGHELPRYAVSMKWCDSPAARAAIARHGPRFAFRFYMG